MTFPSRRIVMQYIAAAMLGSGLITAQAQEFPNKTIRIVVPFPAGQGADAAARALARELETVLGQPVIVDNRPGGNNVIGARAVTGAPADGYTLFYGTNSPMAANAAYFRKLGYDPIKDFAPIARLGRASWVVVVSAASPIRSFEELVRISKLPNANESFAAGSTGYQLAAVLLMHASGLKANLVPYKGTPQAITDVAGQQVTATMSDYGTMRPLIDSGRVRPLLIFDEQRIPSLPEVPSLKDLKLDVPVLSSWTALFAPAGTPPSIVAKLSEATQKAMQGPAYREHSQKTGSVVDYAGPEDLSKFQRMEVDYYRRAMKVGNVEPQ